MDKPQPFTFHIISGAVSGQGCVLSNDDLEGMTDSDGSPVSRQYAFEAQSFIQQLLNRGIRNTPAHVPLSAGGFNVPRQAIHSLLEQTIEDGRKAAQETFSGSHAADMTSSQVASGGSDTDLPYAHEITGEIEALLDGPEQEKVWINLQLLTHALGTRFHEGWLLGKRQVEEQN